MSFNINSPIEDFINQYATDPSVAKQISKSIEVPSPVRTRMELVPLQWIKQNYKKCFADPYSLQRFLTPWHSDRSNSYLTTLLCGLNYKDSFQLALIEPIVADFKRKIETGECSANEIKAYQYSVRELEKLLDQGYEYLILDGQHRLKEIYDYLNGTNKTFQVRYGFSPEGTVKWVDENGDAQIKTYPLGGSFNNLPSVVQANILLNTDVPINFIETGSLKVLSYIFYAINNGLPLTLHENRSVLGNNNYINWLKETILKDGLRYNFWNYVKLSMPLEQKGDTLFLSHFTPWFLLQQDDPLGVSTNYNFATSESNILFQDNFLMKEKYLKDIEKIFKKVQSMVVKFKPKKKIKYTELFDWFYIVFKFTQRGVGGQLYKIDDQDNFYIWMRETQDDRIERDRWVTDQYGKTVEAKHSFKSKLSRMSKENFDQRITEIDKDISRDISTLITNGTIVAVGDRKSSLTIEDIAKSNEMVTGAGKPISKYDLYSKRGEDLEINEILPVSKGGKRTLDNVTIETPKDNKTLYHQAQK